MKKPLSAAITLATLMSSHHTFANDFRLEEVVVTAQKREQNIQDVPIAVTAMNAESMQSQNIEDLVDIQRASPSLSIRPGYNRASQTPVSIRGIGTSGVSPAFEGSVGVYVDGVYRSRPGMVLGTFNDVGSIEILRGPQGTLFGKNTTAGAMTITSQTPSHEFSYGGELTLGNNGKEKAGLYVSGGLTDSLAMRFSALSDQRDGFFEDPYSSNEEGNINIESYKLQTLWDATENLSVKVIVDYAESDENCCFGNSGLVNRTNAPGPLDFLPTAFYDQLAADNVPVTSGANGTVGDLYDRRTHVNTPSANENEDKGITLDVNYAFGDAELRSVTAVRNWQFVSSGDYDFGPADLGQNLTEDYELDSFSQEFNLTGHWENFANGTDYVFGLFYSKETLDYFRTYSEGSDAFTNWQTLWTAALSAQPLDPSDPANFGQSNLLDLFALGYGGAANIPWATAGQTVSKTAWDYEDEVKAAFVHLTISLTDQLSAIASVRYSEEEKTVDRTNLLFDNHADYVAYIAGNSVGNGLLGVNTDGPSFEGETVSEEEWTYNFGLQYFVNDSTQLFGSFARGFKAGGIDLAPDTGGQSPNLGIPGGVAPALPLTYQPEYVDSYEIGLKTDYQDGRGRANIALFRSEFEDIQFSLFSGTGFFIGNAGEAVSQGIEIENTYALSEYLTSNVSLTFLDAEYGENVPAPGREGEALNHAPDVAGTISFNYDRDISSQLALFGNVNYIYRSSHQLVYGSTTNSDGYDTVSLQVGLRDIEDRWSATLWCDNCFDEEYLTFIYNQPFYFDNSNRGYPGEPRTFGLTLRANY